MSIKTYSLLCVLLLIGLGWAHDKATFADEGTLVASETASKTGEAVSFGVVSEGPVAGSSLQLVGRGERALRGATTDVWVHGGYAYLGTFNRPCGTGEVGEAGVHIYDVQDPNQIVETGALPSVAGSRVNDVKVAALATGTLLVHSNERCRGGPGGFELYDVADPLNPVHLAHVQTDSANLNLAAHEDHRDEGVHNLFLFTRDGRDYVAAQVSTPIGSFQIFDVTDPQNVTFVSAYGAENVRWPEVEWRTEDNAELLTEAEAYVRSGFGQSTNRFLHDHYVSPDGQTAYLANWDAGLIRLDLENLAEPRLVSVALEPDSEDGEVNSHSVWPSEDGRVVVEGEEDFSPYGSQFAITSGEKAGGYSSVEGGITQQLSTLAGQTLSGPTVYVGDACEDMLPAPSAEHIALIERGTCTFHFKLTLARQMGYAGAVVFNTEAGGDELVSMGGEGRVNLPAVFVGRSTGLALAGVESDLELSPGAEGESFSVSVEPSGWSGLRIWDYSDPAQPVLASTFNTLCSAYPDDSSCVAGGTYSSHNIIVEGNLAYVSWYTEGVLVLDISDPYAPVESARYRGSDAEQNGEPDVWGIYKVPGEPLLYASDRSNGLHVLKFEPSPGADAEVLGER